MTILSGSVRFCKTNCSNGPDRFTVRVEDEKSTRVVIEITGPLDKMAEALLGGLETACTYELQNLDKAGKYRHSKTELVPVADGPNKGACSRKALRVHETDGWVGNASDCSNSHRYRGLDGKGRRLYEVHFVRYLDVPMPQDPD